MIILDKLRTIFEGKFGDILSNNNITLFNFSRNVQNTLELKEGDKLLSLDLTKALEEEKVKIKKEIIDDIVQNKKNVFLINQTSDKTKRIKENLPDCEDKELLKFYKDKLNLNLYKALEASLIIRSSSKEGEDITELKRDVAKKYPDFGNNLCNLTTRGYFDGHFKELYNSMLEDDNFDILSYQRKVDKIVKSLPYIVFITRYKSYDDLSGEVNFKLEKLKKYGTGKLVLHGLGKENVNTTLSILEEYREESTILVEKRINPNKTIITATLKF